MMTQSTLLKIKDWYQDCLQSLEGHEYQQSRHYLRQRIQSINLMMLRQDEEELLKALDALFLIDDYEQPDTADYVFDLCSRSKGIQEEDC